jgi:preprotein translocase subunit SecG
MLYRVLLVILVLDAFVLIAAILLQSGKGSGLAANFGGASSSPDAFIGIRQAGTILTKATWWGAGIFLGLAFVLQVMSTRAQAPRSVLEKTFSNTPAPALPLPGTTNPAVPLQPLGTPAAGGAAKTAPAGSATVPLAGGTTTPQTAAPGAPATGGTTAPQTGTPVKPPAAPPAKR